MPFSAKETFIVLACWCFFNSNLGGLLRGLFQGHCGFGEYNYPFHLPVLLQKWNLMHKYTCQDHLKFAEEFEKTAVLEKEKKNSENNVVRAVLSSIFLFVK